MRVVLLHETMTLKLKILTQKRRLRLSLLYLTANLEPKIYKFNRPVFNIPKHICYGFYFKAIFVG